MHNRSTPGHLRFACSRAGQLHDSQDSFKGMGVDFGDVNGDGLLDIYVSNIATRFGLTESHSLWLSTGAVASIDVAVKTLATALQAAGLVETLKGPGPFTVFAPTDDAFAKLPVGALEALLKDRQRLAAVLTYHVVPGPVMAADVVKMTAAKTVQRGSLAIRADNGVTVDGAKVDQDGYPGKQRRDPRHRRRPHAQAVNQDLPGRAAAPGSPRSRNL